MNPRTLLNNSLSFKFDLIILDIVMPGMTGIELAKELRKNKINSDIIFITTNTEYAVEAFDVFPLTYITKPINSEKLFEALNKFANKNDFSSSVSVKNELGEKIILPVNSILYLKSQGHSVVYALEDGSDISSTAENFTSAGEKMPAEFYRCHRCFVVNLKKIHSIDKYEFVLENQTRIPISRYNYQEAKRLFTLNS